MTEIQSLRAAYRQEKAAVMGGMAASVASTRGIHKVLRKLSSLTDGLLHTLWQRAEMPSLCVGGGGRIWPGAAFSVL